MTESIESIEAQDGYPLRYRLWPGAKAMPWVVLVHGTMSNTGWLRGFAEQLNARGYTVVGHDRRGSGLNPKGRGDVPDADSLLVDLARILSQVPPEGAGAHLFAWCWGGLVALNLAALRAQPIRSLVLAAPCLYLRPEHGEPFAKHWSLTSAAQEPHTPFIRPPIAEHLFTTGPALREVILCDDTRVQYVSPAMMKAHEEYREDLEAKAGALEVPTLLITGTRDEVIDNERVLRWFASVRAETKAAVEIDAAHGLQFEAPDALATAVLGWLEGAEPR